MVGSTGEPSRPSPGSSFDPSRAGRDGRDRTGGTPNPGVTGTGVTGTGVTGTGATGTGGDRSRGYIEPEAAAAQAVPAELGERLQGGFQDMSRLLGAIKETLQSRDGQVQQTLQALPGFLQQVPRIHRAEIECLAQISKQLEHMGTGTRDVVARLDGLPDLLRTLTVSQAEQAQFLDGLQARLAESLDTQSKAIQVGLEQSRENSTAQLQMIRGLASTQEDIFATFQNTQNRALNVFHRAQQQTNAQHRETQNVMNKQVEMLVDRVHSAQSKVFWLSIGFAALAAAGLIAVVVFT